VPSIFRVPDAGEIYTWSSHVIRIVVILIAAWISIHLQRWIPRLRARIVAHMSEQRGAEDLELEKQAATLGGIIRKTLAVIIWVVAIMMALKDAGFDVAPILAGAGVAGLAVGFGAQNLVQDVISGMFLLLENHLRVNDVAIINGTGGLVEAINLRTTVLRGIDGTVHVFRNGTVTSLANMTHGYSYYVFDIGVAYKEDTDHVVEVVKGIAEEMMKEAAYEKMILAPLEVLGVDKFADSAVIIKARFKTAPIQQWNVGREMNRRIKKKFDELGIEIPFPHTSIYFGEASKPFQLQTQGVEREQLKTLIQEVLDERRGDKPGANVQRPPVE
jgi:moderate conductance mechanosensitive channel